MRFKAAQSGVGMTFSPLIGVKTPKTRGGYVPRLGGRAEERAAGR